MDSNRGPVDYGGYPPRRRPGAPMNRAPRRAVIQDEDAARRRDGAEANASEIGCARLTDREYDAWQHEQNRAEQNRAEQNRAEPPREAPPRSKRASERSARARHQRGRLNQRAAQGSRGATTGNAASSTVSSKRPSRKTKRPFWKRVRRLAGFLVICALIEVGVATLTAPQFAVQSVEIAGLQITQPDELQPVQQWLHGQNWMRAKLGEAKKRVETLPSVREARVVRALQWPPHLQVQVSERQAFARVGAGKDWWIVDQSGMPFRRAEKADGALHALTSALLKPKLGRALPLERWQPAVRLAMLLDAEAHSGREWKLRRVYFDKNDCASLRLSGGFNDELLVQLGASGWRDKLQSARQALTFFAATGQRAASLNLVSSNNRPAWTPRETVVLAAPNTALISPAASTLAAPVLSVPTRPDAVHRTPSAA